MNPLPSTSRPRSRMSRRRLLAGAGACLLAAGTTGAIAGAAFAATTGAATTGAATTGAATTGHRGGACPGRGGRPGRGARR